MCTAHAAAQTLSELDESIPRLMKAWNVPGLAIAVVEDGEVILNRGYGRRELGQTDVVDAHTLFAIGSVTKSFTAAWLGFSSATGRSAWMIPSWSTCPDLRSAIRPSRVW